MLQQRINQWLHSNREFDSGLTLLEEADPACVHLRIFKRSGSTKFNQDKLEQLLNGLIEKVHADPEYVQGDFGFPKYDFFSLPEDLQRDHIRKGELYRSAGQLHAQLSQVKTDEERGRIAELLMRSMQENQRCWERIDYYLTNGFTKKETAFVLPELASMDIIQLARFKANNASNLSKWRKKLNLETDEKKLDELKERIVHHEKLQEQAIQILNTSED